MKSYNLSKKSFFAGRSVNFILISLNIILFFVFTLLTSLNVLSIDDVAIKPLNIINGQYLWTFFTSMFMHAGFFHLFANMLSLLFLGSFIERIIGKKRYLWFYLISGILGGLFFVLLSFIFPSDMNTYAVGASGAIFGIAGLMMVITPNLPLYVMFIPIPIKAKYAIPGLLIVLWLISITGSVSIGNTAHLGGLVAGLIYGFYLKYKFPNKTRMLNRHFS